MGRGQCGAEAVVAEIHYPSEWQQRKNGFVQFSGANAEPMKFTNWMSRAGKGKGEHQVIIAGEEHTWTEYRANESTVVYPVSASHPSR